MFSIHLPEGEPWYSDQRRVLDTGRRISLQFAGGIGSEGVRGFLLSHDAMRLPLQRSKEPPTPPGGARYFVYRTWNLIMLGSKWTEGSLPAATSVTPTDGES